MYYNMYFINVNNSYLIFNLLLHIAYTVGYLFTIVFIWDKCMFVRSGIWVLWTSCMPKWGLKKKFVGDKCIRCIHMYVLIKVNGLFLIFDILQHTQWKIWISFGFFFWEKGVSLGPSINGLFLIFVLLHIAYTM